MPGSEPVNDEAMMMLLFLCQKSEEKSWMGKILSGTK